MPLVPMKQTITVSRSGSTVFSVTPVITRDIDYDDWGKPLFIGDITLKARVTETTKTIKTNTGEEALTTLEIFLDKLADVSYADTITYTNELGVTVERRPLKIEVRRMLSGKPAVTVVYV